PEEANVGLVIKLSHARTGLSWADPSPLLAEIAATPRTFVCDRQLPYAEVLSLAASCDAYVSLHRSEGLGLNLLEAMLLGKPVIATGWSGNMDFMSRADSCPVGYDLVPVRGRHPAYQPEAIGPGQVWAEPRVSEAADWMRRLATDPVLRSEIGNCAGRSALARQADVLRGEVFTILDQLATNAADLGAVVARRNNWQRLSELAVSPPKGRRWLRFLRRLLGAHPT
ncbi:MAG: glycosyltransferase, partial [Planctomycetota bacterium]